jgi:fucose permease
MPPTLLLVISTILSAIGLYGLGIATDRWAIALAATVYAFGICYCWPTMYGITAERFPLGGAFVLSLIGSTGMMSDALVVPLIGRFYDRLGAGLAMQWFAVLPCVAAICFSSIWLYDRMHGGYHVIRIQKAEEPQHSRV